MSSAKVKADAASRETRVDSRARQSSPMGAPLTRLILRFVFVATEQSGQKLVAAVLARLVFLIAKA